MLSSCTTQPKVDNKTKTLEPTTIATDNKIARENAAVGQTVYIPIYSSIYFRNKHSTINLAATLSIRNTDLTNEITIASVFYYDSQGKLLHHYLDEPLVLQPMASQEYLIDQDDTSGGMGASFVVEWYAKNLVSDPVLEAVMVTTNSGRGLSFISSGRIIKKWSKEVKELKKSEEPKESKEVESKKSEESNSNAQPK